MLKNPEKKEQFVREFIAEGGASATKVREQLYEYLMNIADEKELVLKTMSGIRASELNVKMSCPLVSLVKKRVSFCWIRFRICILREIHLHVSETVSV